MPLDAELSAMWSRVIDINEAAEDAGATIGQRRVDGARRGLGPERIDASQVVDEVADGDRAVAADISIASLIDAAMGFGSEAPAQSGPPRVPTPARAAPGPHDLGPDDAGFRRRYQIKGVLGYGGMGEVVLARQHQLERHVAIKLVRDDDGRQEDQRLADFHAESRLTARLEHPNIVPVYEAGERYLVMKRIKGKTLDELILQPMGADRLPQLVEILLRVCDAVSFAHSRGVIHRDLKAANVMVGEFGEVLVLDWGLAASVEADAEEGWLGPPLGTDRQRVCAGTPGCLPPEVACGLMETIGPASDVYMLGALLYHVLTSRLPYGGTQALDAVLRAADNDHPTVRSLVPDSPAGLTALQERAMHTRPEQRGSVEDFAEDLRAWLRFSGNELEARRAFDRGQERLRVAMDYGKRDWDKAYHAYVEAVKEFERATNLWPEFEDAQEARRMTLWTFSRAALSCGDIFLARMLFQGQSPPRGGIA